MKCPICGRQDLRRPGDEERSGLPLSYDHSIFVHQSDLEPLHGPSSWAAQQPPLEHGYPQTVLRLSPVPQDLSINPPMRRLGPTSLRYRQARIRGKRENPAVRMGLFDTAP